MIYLFFCNIETLGLSRRFFNEKIFNILTLNRDLTFYILQDKLKQFYLLKKNIIKFIFLWRFCLIFFKIIILKYSKFLKNYINFLKSQRFWVKILFFSLDKVHRYKNYGDLTEKYEPFDMFTETVYNL